MQYEVDRNSIRCRVHSEDHWSWWWHGEWPRPWWWRWRNWDILEADPREFSSRPGTSPRSLGVSLATCNIPFLLGGLEITEMCWETPPCFPLGRKQSANSWTEYRAPFSFVHSRPWPNFPSAGWTWMTWWEGETGSVVDSRQERWVLDLWRRTCNKLN